MTLTPKQSLQIKALGTYSFCRTELVLDLSDAFHFRFTSAFVNINCEFGAAPQGWAPAAGDSKVPST